MTRQTVSTADSWDDLFDQDIERLLLGGSPENREFAPLESLVSALSTFSESDLREELVQEYSKLAALMVNEERPIVVPERKRLRTRSFFLAIRRRAAIGVSGLMMFSGLAGIAWASDGAVPGDWNYGIDRAMEVFGIGDGGAQERLEELSQLAGTDEGKVVDPEEQAETSVDAPGKPADTPGKPADPGKPVDTPGKPTDPGKPGGPPGS